MLEDSKEHGGMIVLKLKRCSSGLMVEFGMLILPITIADSDYTISASRVIVLPYSIQKKLIGWAKMP